MTGPGKISQEEVQLDEERQSCDNLTNTVESTPSQTPEKRSHEVTVELQPEGQCNDLKGPPAPVQTLHETGVRLVTICLSLALALFCTALDNNIIATAIPQITDEFHSLEDTSWYGSAYFLSLCSLQLFYAKVYTTFNIKWSFLSIFFVFEVGSLVCALAPNSNALIVGRVVAGMGAAGIISGTVTIIAHISPLHLRPTIIGIITGLYPVSGILAPLIGGAFTDGPGWRWCFWINLPIGGVVGLVIISLLRIRTKPKGVDGKVLTWVRHFDPVGNATFVVAIICLLLAIQWGGSRFEFSSPQVIVLFVLFGILLCGFVVSQAIQREHPTIPARIYKSRTVSFGIIYGFCIGGSVFIMLYYLPLYFQAVQGASALGSAIHLLPMIVAQLVGMVSSGFLTTRIGHYMPFVYLSCVLVPIGAGLLTTFTVNISTGRWIGYQILYGAGIGVGFQQATVAVQAAFALKDIPIGVAAILSAQQLGGTIMLGAAQNVFVRHLESNLAGLNIDGFDVISVADIGATQLQGMLPHRYLDQVLAAYSNAITSVFQISLVLGCLMAVGAGGMEWRSLKKKQ